MFISDIFEGLVIFSMHSDSILMILFCFRELKVACRDALAGRKLIQDIGVEKVDKSLVANFDILNLVPDQSLRESELGMYNRSETGKFIHTLCSDDVEFCWKVSV